MDKRMLSDLESLLEEDKIKMARMIDQLQGKAMDSIAASAIFIKGLGEVRQRTYLRELPEMPHYGLWSLRMYNSLVERCFADCVDTFRRESLDKQEDTCVRRCAEKFLKHSMRVGMRFAELNQGAPTPD